MYSKKAASSLTCTLSWKDKLLYMFCSCTNTALPCLISCTAGGPAPSAGRPPPAERPENSVWDDMFMRQYQYCKVVYLGKRDGFGRAGLCRMLLGDGRADRYAFSGKQRAIGDGGTNGPMSPIQLTSIKTIDLVSTAKNVLHRELRCFWRIGEMPASRNWWASSPYR